MTAATKIALRAGIVVVALSLSAMALRTGIATRLSQTKPSLAAQLAPHNARIAIAAAQAAVDGGADVASTPVRKLVNEALARDATLPSAIEFRALEAQSDHDDPRATRLFELSSTISRRSLPTRLWLIQRSVDRGDVARALGDFDIALRTSTAAPAVLFPVLAVAASDPSLAGPIARLLDHPEDWRVMFLHYAIKEGYAATGIVGVVSRMRDRRVITDNHLDQALIGELINQQAFALTRKTYDLFHSRPSQSYGVRDADFSHPEMDYPFGWRLIERGEAEAQRSNVAGRPALAFQALPGGEGPVAVQLLMLSPGDYRLTTSTASSISDPSSPPYWTLTCGETGGQQIALLNQPTAAGAAGSTDFQVPAGCPAQWLALSLRLSDLSNPTGAIRSVSVTPR